MGLELINQKSSPGFHSESKSLHPDLMHALEKMAEKVRSLGYPCTPYSAQALEIYSNLPEERQKKVILQIHTMLNIFSSQDIEPTNTNDGHSEKSLVTRALNFYGLEFRDDFWKVVEDGDIIEIYNEDQIQVFRTLNFFKVTIYSLLDLLVKEWYELWERSSMALASMQNIADTTLKGQQRGIVRASVMPHVVKEKYNAFNVENFESITGHAYFKYVCPLYKKDLPMIKGFLITCEVKIVARGEESRGLSFI